MNLPISHLTSPFFALAVCSTSNPPHARIVYKTTPRTGNHQRSYLAEIRWSYVHKPGEPTGAFEWGPPIPLDRGFGVMDPDDGFAPDNFALSYDTDFAGRHLFIGDVVGEQQEISIRSVLGGSQFQPWSAAVKLLYSDGTLVVARKHSKLAAAVVGQKLHLHFVNPANEIVLAVGTASSEDPGIYVWTLSDKIVASGVLAGSNMAIGQNRVHSYALLYQTTDGSLQKSEFGRSMGWHHKHLLLPSQILSGSPLAFAGGTDRFIFYVHTIESKTRTYSLGLPEGPENASWAQEIAAYTLPNSIGVIGTPAHRFITISIFDGEPALVQRMRNQQGRWAIQLEIETSHEYQGQRTRSSSPVLVW